MRPSTPPYPRGTPHQPLQDMARAARLRLWTFLLLGAAAVLVVVTVAAGVFWASRLTAAPAPAPAPVKPAAPVLERLTFPDLPKIAPKNPKTPTRPGGADQSLEALGGLSAAHLYQTFLNVGLLADGVENETYTAAEAEKLLNTVLGLMDLVDRHLQKLSGSDLDGEDRRSLERVRSLSGKLRAQAEGLRAYWASDGDAAAAERYHRARDEAWAGLNELLGGEK